MINLYDSPSAVLIQTDGWHKMNCENGGFSFGSAYVELVKKDGGVAVYLTASEPVKAICIRHRGSFNENTRVLGDAWERAYADLGFTTLRPERAMPWYFLANDGYKTDGYGVKTGCNSFCSFYAHGEGIDLLCDVRNGSRGVKLCGRKLLVCTVVIREGKERESAFSAGRAFCKMLCDSPRMPKKIVYGSNNWYYAYGNTSHGEVIADSDLLAELTAGIENRPYMVLDDGWQVKHKSGWGGYNGGPWDQGNEKFPDMARLAREMSERDVLPGIWFRPLHFRGEQYEKWGLMRNKEGFDVTLPEVQEQIYNDTKRIVDWGYKLIKHDFSTVDITGKFGPWMAPGNITDGDWSFKDESRTTAEIILDFYNVIRRAAGDDTVIIGCNTFSHLSAGIFELQRTGDDTSGTEWARTRRYGVNTVAFRGIQHEAFYACDGDCVGVTDQVPWEQNRQWLELLAKSGTPLFVSPDPKILTAEQKTAIRNAYLTASKRLPLGEPLDWLYNDCPRIWRFGDEIRTFDWVEKDDFEIKL